MKLKRQHYNNRGLSYADFFPQRHKKKIFELADLKPTDILYDLGCGDASILIFAVKNFKIKKAIGFEDNSTRNYIARINVKKARLSDRIIIKNDDFEKIDVSEADVIFDML